MSLKRKESVWEKLEVRLAMIMEVSRTALQTRDRHNVAMLGLTILVGLCIAIPYWEVVGIPMPNS